MRCIEERKRRKVVRVAAVDAAAAFVVLQAADPVLPKLGVPDWAMSLVVVLNSVFSPDGRPMVSPDGRFLFFSRRQRAWEAVTGGDVFWVDAEVIHRLRPQAHNEAAFAITDGGPLGVANWATRLEGRVRGAGTRR